MGRGIIKAFILVLVSGLTSLEAAPWNEFQKACRRIFTKVTYFNFRDARHPLSIYSPLTRIPGVIDAVAVAIKNQDGKYLLNLRGASPMKHMWGFLGGKLDPQETIADAARREVLEEANIEITGLTLNLTHFAYLHENGFRYRVFVVIAEGFWGEPKIMEADKALQMEWFAIDKLPRPLTTATLEFFKKNQ